MTSAAFNAYASTYTPDQEQSIRVALAAQGLTAEQVEKVIGDLQAYYGGGAGIQAALSWMSQQYAAGVTDLDTLVTQAAGIYGKDIANLALEKFTPFVNNGKKISNPAIQEAYLSYVGSYDKAMADTIKADLQNLGWSDEDISTLIGMLDKAVDAQEQTVVDKTIKTLDATATVAPETIIMNDLQSALKSYEVQLNTKEITADQYSQYQKSINDAAVKAYEWAVKSVDNMANAYAMFGFDEAEWAEMDDAQRESAIMDAMAEYKKEGLISKSSYRSLVNDWVVSEIGSYKRKNPNDYIESVGSVVYDLTTFPLSSDARSEIIDSIIKEIGFDMEQLTLSWNVNGKIKQAGVSLKSSNKEVTNMRGALLKAGYYSPYGTERYSVYNGVIYVSYDDAGQTWYEVSENNIKFTGVPGIAESGREGIYAMVARVIETKLQRPDDTRR